MANYVSYRSSACRQPARLPDRVGKRKSLSKFARRDKSFQPKRRFNHVATETTTGLDWIFLSVPIVLDLARVPWNSAA